MSTLGADNQIFEMDFSPLTNDPTLSEFVKELAELSRIDSQDVFDAFCQNACFLWDRHFPESRGSTSALFNDLCKKISGGAVKEKIIPTSWGGVVVTQYMHPEIEKYLVVRKGGYLAMEQHLEKEEVTEVQEGRGILLARESSDAPLKVFELKPGGKYHFMPGMEHCIIATEDLLMFERSTDPKGMDQDLIFIFDGTVDA